MTVTEVILYHAKSLIDILRRELEVERTQLLDKLHARTLERIFIEERVYKKIETQKTREKVINAVIKGMDPYRDQIQREVTEDDVERLLKIPIRRISLYDINKAQEEVREINDRLKAIAFHLAHIVEYALDYINEMKNAASGVIHPRLTKIISFDKVDVREAANRDLILKYDLSTGYIGYGLKTGVEQCKVSHYDRLLIIKKSGTYFVTDALEKLFVDKGMRFCSLTDKDILEKQIITVIYQDRKSKDLYIKRCQITQFIMNKTYELIPENCKMVNLFTRDDAEIFVEYKPKKRLKVLEESFYFHDYLVKGIKAGGVRLTSKEVKTLKIRRIKQE